MRKTWGLWSKHPLLGTRGHMFDCFVRADRVNTGGQARRSLLARKQYCLSAESGLTK